MISVESLADSSSLTVLQSARALFRAYGEFIRSTGEHHGFDFERLRLEEVELPAAYSSANGDVLVAVARGVAIGCIAFREFAAADDRPSCEIKRLFVLPNYRAQGIGSILINAVLDHARLRGYIAAYLDTEPTVMATAYHAYLKFGFIEYERRGLDSCPTAFLHKSLR